MSTTFSFIRQFLYSQIFVSLPYPTTDFTGKTVIVTGANTGLGFEAAKHFVRLNATKVIIACRNLQKGQAAKLSMENTLKHTNKNTIEVWQLDLSSFESVKDFAAKVNTLERLDVLVENAGIGTEKWTVTEGNESTITTNVISTELLALLVLPKLKETALRFNVLPRLSIVSSDLHFLLDFPERKEEDIFAALNDQKKSKIGERYQVTKLIEIFFVRSLASRLSANNNKQQQVIVNCMTPGACSSDFFRDEGFFARLKKIMVTVVGIFIARTAEQGARTLLAGAIAGMESHGEYMADCVVAKPSNLVLSDEGKLLQERLWEQTMKKLEAIQPGISKNIEA